MERITLGRFPEEVRNLWKVIHVSIILKLELNMENLFFHFVVFVWSLVMGDCCLKLKTVKRPFEFHSLSLVRGYKSMRFRRTFWHLCHMTFEQSSAVSIENWSKANSISVSFLTPIKLSPFSHIVKFLSWTHMFQLLVQQTHGGKEEGGSSAYY